MKIAIQDVVVESNPRGHTGDCTELVASMLLIGQLQPVIVKDIGDGKWALVAGRRRMAAAKSLGWDQIEAVQLSAPGGNESMFLAMAVAENTARRQMNWLAVAEAIGKLVTLGWTGSRIMVALGMDMNTVMALRRLLESAPEVKDAVKTGRMSLTAFMQIAADRPDKQAVVVKDAAGRARKDVLTVDAVRKARNTETVRERVEATSERMVDAPDAIIQGLNQALRLIQAAANALPFEAVTARRVEFLARQIRLESDRLMVEEGD